MNTVPIIGYILDHENAQTYSKLPWYAIRENYVHAVDAYGGLPLALPYLPQRAQEYLDQIDALVVIGGDFDIDPKLYGVHETHERIMLKPSRTEFELAMARGAMQRKMPVLGICGGHQVLNVACGGSLMLHVPDYVQSDIEHEQPNPRNEVGHRVQVKPDSLLHRLVGQNEIGVNSAHHQAVLECAPQLVVSGTAPDGVIEAIEHPDLPYCLGVQWHPEYHVTPADDAIWEGFVKAAREYRA